ncbi:hypothetical protein GGI35DRAFT_198371 [Trichoderma velutinum]
MDLDVEFHHSPLKNADIERTGQAVGNDQGKSVPASVQDKIPEFMEILASWAEEALAECRERLQKSNRPEQPRERHQGNRKAYRVDMSYRSSIKKEMTIWKGLRKALNEAVELRETLRMVIIKRPLPPYEEWDRGVNRIENIEWYMLVLNDAMEYLELALTCIEAHEKSAGPGRCSIAIIDLPKATPNDLRRLLACLKDLYKHLLELAAFWSTLSLYYRIAKRIPQRFCRI